MKYEYKIDIQRIGKWSSMTFVLPKNIELVSIFLASDAQGDGTWFIKQLDPVLSGEKEYDECYGNMCGLEIHKDFTKVFDSLAEEGKGEWCTIETVELKNLLLAWNREIKKFNEENKS